MRIGVIAACAMALVGDARADRVAPPKPMAAVRGTVQRVVDVTLPDHTHVVLVEWTRIGEDVPPADLPFRAELVPFDPRVCPHVYALAETSKGLKRGHKRGGLLVDMDQGPWCEVQGVVAMPDFTELARAAPDAILPALAEIYDFFGADGPYVADLEQGFDELDSDTALRFALDRGMYELADRHVTWGMDISHLRTVEDAFWAMKQPDPSLASLYWRLSPGNAAARTRAEHARDPQRGLAAAIVAPPWDEAVALQTELGLTPPNRDRMTITGTKTSGGCTFEPDPQQPELRVTVECAAETLDRMYALPEGTPVVVTGNVHARYDGPDYVQLTLHEATMQRGQAPPPAIDAGAWAGAIDVDAAPAPHRKRARREDGGCCDTGGDAAPGMIVVIAWVLAWIGAPCGSRGGARTRSRRSRRPCCRRARSGARRRGSRPR